MRKDRGLETKVGLFVLAGVSLLLVMIFLLGAERHAFEGRVVLTARFEDVEGLKVGAPVRLAGLDVGVVRGIGFSSSAEDRRLVVELQVRESVLDRIRTDSIATIGSRGVLGDKTIDVLVGTPSAPPVQEGSELPAKAAADISTLLVKADRVLDNTVEITNSVRNIADAVADSDVQKDLGHLVKTLAELVSEVKGGRGFLHSIVYDDAYQKRIFQALDDLAESGKVLRGTADDVSDIVRSIRKGPGALNALIYDPKGAELVAELGQAATQIEAITRSMREERGIVHQLVFAQPGKDPVGDLAETARTLREIVRRIDKGEGTIGALIKDPSVYEDLKLTLGEVRRNQLLKAVLRMAIESRDETPPQLQKRP